MAASPASNDSAASARASIDDAGAPAMTAAVTLVVTLPMAM